MVEKVNHPTHYNWFGIECLDVVRNFNFCLGNAIKYVWRAGFKPGEDALDDLSKAKFYIESEMDRIRDERHYIARNTEAPLDESDMVDRFGIAPAGLELKKGREQSRHSRTY